MPEPKPITDLLIRWGAGERECLDRLLPAVEDELRRIARGYMRRERPGHTLQTTALMNEAYLKLVDQKQADWKSRAHFFAAAARIMRQILVDHARGIGRAKRGGGRPLPLDENLAFSPEKSAELIALDEALDRLAAHDGRLAQVVELRYFGGLSVKEAAAFLGVHENTVIRDWSLAKAWLHRELESAS